jgi:HME family heavy-metal exporter
VIVALIVFSTMGKEFLPAFNEGTVTAFVVTPPGTSLDESNRVGTIAEKLLLSVPEIKITGRRTGRAEQDEHAEGVYNSEIDVELHPSSRTRDEILSDLRSKLNQIPGIAVSLGQPIAHRLDHMMSGVQAQIAVKIFGEDLSTLRALAEDIKVHISEVEGIADLQVERMTTVPQIQISPLYSSLAAAGIAPGHLSEQLEHILSGQNVGEIIEGQKRTVISLRIREESRQNAQAISGILIDSPSGSKHRLNTIATVAVVNGPNAINHENSRRRIVVSANTEGRDLGSVIEDIQNTIAKDIEFPNGYYVVYDGQFESQKSATRKIAMLSTLSLLGVFFILYGYFGSLFLVAQVMVNIPLALIGAVAAVYISGGVFSVGTLVGFITLCGIASRNGILLLSHYLYLMEHEGHVFGKEMVVKGSLERLVPMLMTALRAVLALTPLALAANVPGKEILHPVAVVILGGLLTSTLLDMVVTPTLFLNYGERSASKALEHRQAKKDPARRVS